MKKLINYTNLDLLKYIDEIEIGTKLGCRLDNNLKIVGKLIKNENNIIKIYNDIDGMITVKKSFIKELRVEIEEDNKMSKKEKLLTELEQIKNEFKEKIENIQKQIENEEIKKEYWIPNNGEEYYFVASDGGVSISAYTDMSDLRKIDFLNCFKTQKEAERVAFEQLLHRKLKKFADLNNEEEINWKSRENKYTIIYNNFNDIGLTVEIYISFQNFGQISFSSREIAEKAIEEFRDDLIRYFTTDK